MPLRQPAVFLPHGGGPCFFMDWTMGPADTWDAMAAWLRQLVTGLPERPKALLVVSAHWEAPVATVHTGTRPGLLFDYYGFPAHTYALQWPAPGDPALAARVAGLIAAAGIPVATEPDRGWDHGVFVPLLLAVPDADIPTVQLSLVAGLDPAAHLALGRALAPLRDEGVLILGSGLSFHNLRAIFRPEAVPVSQAFDAWLEAAVTGPDRDAALTAWARAPSARAAHPREEHLLPLHVVVGAGGDDPARVVFRDDVLGSRVSAVQVG